MWLEDGPEPEACPDGPADPSPGTEAGPEAADNVCPDEDDTGPGGTTGRREGCCGRLGPAGAAPVIPGAFMADDFGRP